MDDPRLSFRVARLLTTTDISGKQADPLELFARATSTVANMAAGSPTTESCNNSSEAIEDPAVVSQKPCHFMELPSEIRLSIYERTPAFRPRPTLCIAYQPRVPQRKYRYLQPDRRCLIRNGQQLDS
jgi:hypothetical protein